VAQPTAVQVPAEPDVAVPVHVYGSDAVQMFVIAVGTWKIHSSDQGYGLNKWAGKGNPLSGEQGGLAGCITPSVNTPPTLTGTGASEGPDTVGAGARRGGRAAGVARGADHSGARAIDS